MKKSRKKRYVRRIKDLLTDAFDKGYSAGERGKTYSNPYTRGIPFGKYRVGK